MKKELHSFFLQLKNQKLLIGFFLLIIIHTVFVVHIFNSKQTRHSHAAFNHLLFLAVELIILGIIIVSLWSIHRFTTPLKNIQQSAERLGIDMETKPFDVYGPKAVREVSLTLNQMQKRIIDLVQSRTQLLAAISHDLRTPIARARLHLQFTEESVHKTKLLADLTEMETMISETLSFAREDTKREEKKKIDLVSLLESICNDEYDMQHNVRFQSNSHRIPYFGRVLALKRAFSNLITNAVRYAGNAEVAIFKKEHSIVIEINDNGAGIAEDELKKVFEPFYRGEHSRSKNTGGVGLGLTITRDIVIAHQGKIKLKNKKPQGLSAIIEFPL